MIPAGSRAPGFHLAGETRVGQATFRLADFADEGPVLLAFLPLRRRPGRTLRAVLDLSWLQLDDDVAVVVVADADRRLARRLGGDLPPGIPVLSDPSGRVAAAYDAADDAGLVLVDDSRVVRRTWRLPETTAVDVAAVREAATAATPRPTDYSLS